jgi:Sulfotransferase family
VSITRRGGDLAVAAAARTCLRSRLIVTRQVATPRPSPDFLCIGAQRAGTTWLYENLKTHPGVWLPPEKELHYFDEKAVHPLRELVARSPSGRRWLDQLLRRGHAWRSAPSMPALRWYLRYFFGRRSDEWYSALFEQGAFLRTGELTPAYATLSRDEIARVHRLVPDVRIIFLMRNPVERAWSQALLQVRYGHLPADAGAMAEHFRSEESRSRGDYLCTIEHWSQFFDTDRIFIGFMEDIHFHPHDVLRRLCAFLGIDEDANWPYLRIPVYRRSHSAMPLDSAADLAGLYRDRAAAVAERFGGFAEWWHYCCERLIEQGNDRDITFPFYESRLWTEWSSGFVPPIQSGILTRWSDTSR